MAIRFRCGACGQPIEVDDPWAGKVVACPYCRKTVSAPVESTIGDVSEIPTATALSDLLPGETIEPHGEALRPDDRNSLAVVAAVLAAVLVLLVIGGAIVNSVYKAEISEYMDAVGPASTTLNIREGMNAVQDYLNARGAIPIWMVLMNLIFLAFAMVWVATLICGIIAVRRPAKKSLSAAALILAGITPLLGCCLTTVAVLAP